MTSRIYGSPGLLSDDSAVESWESSTQRDISPNDTPFQNTSSDTDGQHFIIFSRNFFLYSLIQLEFKFIVIFLRSGKM